MLGREPPERGMRMHDRPSVHSGYDDLSGSWPSAARHLHSLFGDWNLTAVMHGGERWDRDRQWVLHACMQ